jgi:AraC-like DNA-binding protein
MQEHLTDQITLKDIADHLGYGLSRTHALIKSGTGLSPHAYLLRLRVNEAADALSRRSSANWRLSIGN